jgi:TatD DNase family protein
MFIDSHCHLDDFRYEEELTRIIKDAEHNDVKYFLSAGTKISEIKRLQEISGIYHNVFYTIGIHPHYAKDEKPSTEELIKLASHPKVLGIGEAGLDYYRNNSPKKDQIEVFLSHIKAAQETGLPLMAHTRDADDDMINILEKDYKNKPFSGVIHCFSSSKDFAKRVLDIGFYISVSGSITFKNAENLRTIIKIVPNDKLLIETDCPYLAPEPFRGKMNYPEYVVYTASMLAEIKGNLTTQEVGDITTNNFKKLYSKKLKGLNIC